MRMNHHYLGAALLMTGLLGHQPALADALGQAGVLELHERIAPVVDNPTPESPFYITAEVQDHIESSEAALYFPQSVDDIAILLQEESAWCEILPLHINIKACTFNAERREMTIYMGRKFYQDPEDAYQLTYQFQTRTADGYFAATAAADEGPMGTSDYRIDFEVVTTDAQSFARIHVSDHQSWTSSNAMRVYLHTKGADKEGIHVVDHDDDGKPVFSKGMPAVAERNLLRYYFAFAAFFDAANIDDPAARHEQQLNFWFDQTARYPQLYEMDKAAYLDEKRRERQNQLALQAAQSP